MVDVPERFWLFQHIVPVFDCRAVNGGISRVFRKDKGCLVQFSHQIQNLSDKPVFRNLADHDDMVAAIDGAGA